MDTGTQMADYSPGKNLAGWKAGEGGPRGGLKSQNQKASFLPCM